jgi:hypothetical protein
LTVLGRGLSVRQVTAHDESIPSVDEQIDRSLMYVDKAMSAAAKMRKELIAARGAAPTVQAEHVRSALGDGGDAIASIDDVQQVLRLARWRLEHPERD